MKFTKIALLISSLTLVACSSSTASQGTFIANEATNYLMPKCPNSDLTATKARNQIAPAVLECLGHDEFVNLAGLPNDRPIVISFWASWCTWLILLSFKGSKHSCFHVIILIGHGLSLPPYLLRA